ncbi:hypothetical protein EDD86DRAFT_178471, partial [Gorgonomyces haynaldii]
NKVDQGDYDAVYLNKPEGLCRFVQITRGQSHSFKIHYFYDLLRKFADIGLFEIRKLHIIYLIPEARKAEFKV